MNERDEGFHDEPLWKQLYQAALSVAIETKFRKSASRRCYASRSEYPYLVERRCVQP
jgi:hypothetical protein